jgi:urease accessory protein
LKMLSPTGGNDMKKLLTAVAFSAIASPALAHTGHSHADGLIAGFMHPFMGADHLLAMVAVGLFGAAAMRGRVWAAPATFVSAMIGGALLAYGGMALPMVEGGIALSVLLLGLMCAFALKVPTTLALGLTALFAMFHGYAHGAEATGGALAYVAGFSVATALLHGAGVLIGLKATAYRYALPVLGGGIAAAGVAFLAG